MKIWNLVARLYQLPRVRSCVDETLRVLGLTDRQRQLAGDLSGGWKQRLALAAVTMHNPKLLLLDEPTAGVDPQARREFWDQIHRLANEGLTVLVSTHYMDEAERCDKIAYLAHGNLMTQGTVQDIIKESRLITFRAEGPNVRTLAARLEGAEGVEHAAYFGAALHVSGVNRQPLEEAIARCARPEDVWQEVPPNLEDVFISLMSRAGKDERSYL